MRQIQSSEDHNKSSRLRADRPINKSAGVSSLQEFMVEPIVWTRESWSQVAPNRESASGAPRMNPRHAASQESG